MRASIAVGTTKREELIDITAQVKAVVQRSAVSNGLVNVYAQGADCGSHDPGELG